MQQKKKKKKNLFKAIQYTEIIGTAQLYASFTFWQGLLFLNVLLVGYLQLYSWWKVTGAFPIPVTLGEHRVFQVASY